MHGPANGTGRRRDHRRMMAAFVREARSVGRWWSRWLAGPLARVRGVVAECRPLRRVGGVDRKMGVKAADPPVARAGARHRRIWRRPKGSVVRSPPTGCCCPASSAPSSSYPTAPSGFSATCDSSDSGRRPAGAPAHRGPDLCPRGRPLHHRPAARRPRLPLKKRDSSKWPDGWARAPRRHRGPRPSGRQRRPSRHRRRREDRPPLVGAGDRRVRRLDPRPRRVGAERERPVHDDDGRP